jgi:hypothetical protein
MHSPLASQYESPGQSSKVEHVPRFGMHVSYLHWNVGGQVSPPQDRRCRRFRRRRRPSLRSRCLRRLRLRCRPMRSGRTSSMRGRRRSTRPRERRGRAGRGRGRGRGGARSRSGIACISRCTAIAARAQAPGEAARRSWGDRGDLRCCRPVTRGAAPCRGFKSDRYGLGRLKALRGDR